MSWNSRTNCTFSLSQVSHSRRKKLFLNYSLWLNLQTDPRLYSSLEVSPSSQATGPYLCSKFSNFLYISFSIHPTEFSGSICPGLVQPWTVTSLRADILKLATLCTLSSLVWILTHSVSPGIVGAPVSGKCPPLSPSGCDLWPWKGSGSECASASVDVGCWQAAQGAPLWSTWWNCSQCPLASAWHFLEEWEKNEKPHTKPLYFTTPTCLHTASQNLKKEFGGQKA